MFSRLLSEGALRRNPGGAMTSLDVTGNREDLGGAVTATSVCPKQTSSVRPRARRDRER
jgi:hypothetical protein